MGNHDGAGNGGAGGACRPRARRSAARLLALPSWGQVPLTPRNSCAHFRLPRSVSRLCQGGHGLCFYQNQLYREVCSLEIATSLIRASRHVSCHYFRGNFSLISLSRYLLFSSIYLLFFGVIPGPLERKI